MAASARMWDEAYVPEQPEPTPFQSLIAAAIERLPETRNYYDRIIQARLKTSGKPLFDIARRSYRPKRETLLAVSDVLQQPMELLEKALDGKDVEPASSAQNSSPARSVRRVEAGHRGDQPEQAKVFSADAGEVVSITRLDLSLPMGPGATVDEYVEDEPVFFDLAYVRSFTRTQPERLRLARGIGESMYPTLNNNDLVWIDSTQRDLNQSDRVWAVSINGAAAIKRLRPLKAGRVLVISDNPAIDNYEVERDELLLGGRVIRFARDL